MELHLKIIGYILIALSIIHVVFPNYFKWNQELSGLVLINRQLMYIHTFFIALVVLLMGTLCISSAEDLISTRLGSRVIFGMFIFWSIRLIIQFFGYSPQLWRGKKFETVIHIFFSLLWTYISTVLFMIYFNTSHI